MSDMVELHSQFSQVTRHAVAARKSENTPVNQVAEQDAPEGNVTLISKYLEACRAPEKIPPVAAPDDVWKADCETLSKMELRRHYSREANCHRNMLSRRKTQGAVVSPLFEDFRSFLKIVGPMPAKGTTLDRIDNADPEYAPGKVRWADKRTQNTIRATACCSTIPAPGILTQPHVWPNFKTFPPPPSVNALSAAGPMMK